MNTTENNKMIAEFMGVNEDIKFYSNKYSWSDAPFFYTNSDSKEMVIESISNYVKYHCSWDWLMPVVEKIGSIEGVKAKIKYLEIFQHSSIFSPIQAIYFDCIDFIKWYNENK